ncbi:MAG: CpaF family protein [Deltaproteobacteria bacterium]|nr:CpaF family protein [Deltaproteobacteria bacterium]
MQKIDLALLDNPRSAAVPAAMSPQSGSKTRTVRTKHKGLTPALAHILEEVQREIGYEQADPNSQDELSNADLQELIQRVAVRLGFELAPIERDEILSLLEKSQREFGILQELVDDPKTSDIIVTNYSKITVQQSRSNLNTDLSFPNQQMYEAFVEKILQKAGTTYSTAKPIADGMVGSYARIHAVHKCLCESGPYLTIRLNRFPTVTVDDLLGFCLAPKEILNYLQAMVKAGNTILVVGEVGTGKTTLVRALASSMPAYECILVIEDTPEIILEHPHVRYMYTRNENTDGAGRVSPSECIRAGMRMAMNRIIFGEMRDAEAAESFIDVCASGHPGLSTIHARNASEAISRLELFLGRAQKGVARQVVYEQIAKSIQCIVFIDICRDTGKRRIYEVKEIGPVAEGVIRQREMFKYVAVDGRPTWKVPNRTSAHREELEKQEVFLNQIPSVLQTRE